MKRIGLLSDTHGFVHSNLYKDFADCDEIWHAGDMGSLDVADELKLIKPLRGVHGNIDDWSVRSEYPKHQRFMCEDVDVWMTHIGGYPNRYDRSILKELMEKPPKLFICGHSHILKVIYDKKLDLLHINPGAAGKRGIHTILTYVKFDIDGSEIKDLKIMENSRK